MHVQEDSSSVGIAPARRRALRLVTSAAVAMGLALTIAVASSGARSGAAPGAPRPATIAHAKATVKVLYAASLLNVMELKVGPAFTRATGYGFAGYAAGSKGLANQIKSGVRQGDVFVSASPAVNDSLAGAANGNWVSSYTEFGYSRLLLGYNPASRFETKITTKPWYDVVDLPGFRLGRTDPAVDPKGVLAANALVGVSLSYARPALAGLASSNANVFDETTLVGELQAGQLDAGFFYRVEAVVAHLRTVALPGTQLEADYTVARLNRAPHPTAAAAFVKFLLGAQCQKILKVNGVSAFTPFTVHKY